MSPLTVVACAVLRLFALRPGLTGALLILASSGGLGCYQLAANAAFVTVLAIVVAIVRSVTARGRGWRR
jgi:hypothetical protein